MPRTLEMLGQLKDPGTRGIREAGEHRPWAGTDRPAEVQAQGEQTAVTTPTSPLTSGKHPFPGSFR
jgi:hypothetical protein